MIGSEHVGSSDDALVGIITLAIPDISEPFKIQEKKRPNKPGHRIRWGSLGSRELMV
jgi:hypothetical protein